MFEPSPFLKWVGGKGQLLGRLLEIFPTQVNTYNEPFFGGGAVFWALAKKGFFQRAVINDVNQDLMDTVRIVRDFPEDLIGQLSKLPYDKEVFEQLRAADISKFSPVRRAARVIYLNKTGFNGLYRVNQKGQFNVSFGKYTNPSIYKETTLLSDSLALEKFVWIQSVDFETSCSEAQPGDLVYLDPPYVPLSETSNFTSFTKGGFGLKEQTRLADLFRTLSDRGVTVVASNSNTGTVRELYKGAYFHEVDAKRNVNSKGDKRGPVKELIICNYKV
jgi:DNA adenine methylase